MPQEGRGQSRLLMQALVFVVLVTPIALILGARVSTTEVVVLVLLLGGGLMLHRRLTDGRAG